MGPTRSLANYWGGGGGGGGGGRKILDMYLISIEIYWWSDGDDNDDDKKNEVRSQQVLKPWQFGIYSYSYTQPCVWDIFRWIVIQIIYFYGEHEAINAVGVCFLHDDTRCIIHYISQMNTDAYLGHHCSCRFDVN